MKKSLVFLGLALMLLGGLYWIAVEKETAEEECPFCNPRILEIQAFYEGEKALGILTHKPATQGHVLVIPKRHVAHFEDLNVEEIDEIGRVIQKVDGAVKKVYGSTGYFLLQKNGSEAGQTVFHLHFHYVPCTQGESVILSYLRYFAYAQFRKALSEEEMRPLAMALREEISSDSIDKP